MKKVQLYLNTSNWIDKILLFSNFIKFPFFVLHELSHLISLLIFSKNFNFVNYKFFEIKNNKIVFCQLGIDVEGEVDFGVAVSSIMPSIIYFSLLFFSFVLFTLDMNYTNFLIYVYILFGCDIGTCSVEDKRVYKQYFKNRILKKRK